MCGKVALANAGTVGLLQDLADLLEGEKTGNDAQADVIGNPAALIGHVRFDERGWETGRRSGVSARAHPRLYTELDEQVAASRQ
jgi:hypothetical protein